MTDCDECNGTGECPKCHGELAIIEECDVCGGSGDCQACDGDGTFDDELDEDDE